MRRYAIAMQVLTLALAACAPELAPPPATITPRYQEFVFPSVPDALVRDQRAVERHDRGWRFLQANDLRSADREFSAALKRNAAFFPAEAGLGYVALAQKDYRGALGRFDRALARSPRYPSALVGRGDALLGLGRTGEALKMFEAALAADPSLAIARERIQVLQLRTLKEQLASARKAADAGRLDEARQAYERAIAASPDSAFLYRDLGAVERKQGDRGAALASYRKAVALDSGDAQSFAQIGDLLEESGDFDGAMQAYQQAAAIEPGPAIAQRLDRARERALTASLPPEYAGIPQAARITRADLAALVGIHFPKLLETQRSREVVITDSRASWASPWILAVVRAGVMDVFPNHTFRPRAAVQRSDLARATSRLLGLAAEARPSLAARWRSAPPTISDVPVGHLAYPAVAEAVASGVVTLFPDGTFRPAQSVSGQEAIQAVDRIEKLIGATATGGQQP